MSFSDKIANNVTELIGHTPLVRFNRIARDGSADLLAKLEYFNPGGSVKDRICLEMIEDAEKRIAQERLDHCRAYFREYGDRPGHDRRGQRV